MDGERTVGLFGLRPKLISPNTHKPFPISKHTRIAMSLPSLSRFPKFELSYETVHHKKVCASDSVAIAVPMGKKHFVWFHEKRAYLVDLNKDRAPIALKPLDISVPPKYVLETVLLVTATETASPLIIEDMYVAKGVPLSNLCFGDRLGFIREFLETFPSGAHFALSCLWHVQENAPIEYTIPLKPGYGVHHIQYREIGRHAPYVNVYEKKLGLVEPKTVAKPACVIPRFDYSAPQFRQPTIFQVVADVQFDIYHAYAKDALYCGPLGIPSYKTSVFMNGIFRNIRENRNLDYIEESDEEDDFENTDENKYVDLDKVVKMECVFSMKHKNWVPVRIAKDTDLLVPIERLTVSNNNRREVYNGVSRPRPQHFAEKRGPRGVPARPVRTCK